MRDDQTPQLRSLQDGGGEDPPADPPKPVLRGEEPGNDRKDVPLGDVDPTLTEREPTGGDPPTDPKGPRGAAI